MDVPGGTGKCLEPFLEAAEGEGPPVLREQPEGEVTLLADKTIRSPSPNTNARQCRARKIEKGVGTPGPSAPEHQSAEGPIQRCSKRSVQA